MKRLTIIFKNGNSLQYNCKDAQEVTNVKNNFGSHLNVFQIWSYDDQQNFNIMTPKEFFN